MSKLIHQVGLRISPELNARLEKLADREMRQIAEIVRILVESALPAAEEAPSLASFARRNSHRTIPYSPRVSQATQDNVQTALRMIFDHAPSSVIERVVEFISERAARYEEAARERS